MRPASFISIAAALALSASLAAVPAAAASFSRLQILLPGETAAPGTSTGKTGTPKPQVANLPFTITVRACDNQWNLVNTATDAIQILSTDASATLPAAGQLTGGTQAYTVTLNAAGNFSFQAHDQSDLTIPDGSSASVPTQVLMGFRFSSTGRSKTAGVSFSMTITAVDPSLNTVQGFNGVVNLKEMTNFGDAACSPSTITLSNGSWSGSVTVYRMDQTAVRGAVLYAWLSDQPSKDGTSDWFNVNANSYSRILVVLPGQTPAPATPSGLSGTPSSQISGTPFSVTIYATDNWWNQIPASQDVDDRVRLTTTDPAGVTPSSSAMTDGTETVNVTLFTVGTQTLTASDRDDSTIQPMTTAGITVLPAAATRFAIDPIPSPQTAGVPVNVTIRAVDASGNTVPGFSSDAVVFGNTGVGSISPETITFTNGVWSGPMIFRGAGASVSFTCADFATNPHTGTSNQFTVTAGPFVAMQVLLPGETVHPGTTAGKSGTPTNQSAGSAFTATVRAVDQFWNVVNTVTDSVALQCSDPFAVMPAETTLTAGQVLVPVRIFRSGPQHISVSDALQPAITPATSANVTIVGGAFARVLVLAPGESDAPGTVTGRSGTPTDQSINYSFSCSILACDTWWNPVGGVSDVVHLSSGDPLAQVGPDVAMANGQASISVKLASGGWQQITVTDQTNGSKTGSTTQVRAISSGLHLEATVTPTTAPAGEPFTLTVRAVNDAGSVIQEINSWVTATVQNASTSKPGKGALLSTTFQLLQGQRSISESYSAVEPIVIVCHDDAGNAPAITNAVTVTPGPPAAIKLTSNPTWLGGNQHAALTALLTDQFGNGIPSQPMSFTMIGGTGTLTPIDSQTQADGSARADLQAPRQPESEVVRASAGGISSDLTVQVSLVDPNAPGGTVTNFPNPCHPPQQGTTLAYKLDDNASVKIRIFSQTGQLVKEVDFGTGASGGRAGLNTWQWDGRNGAGQVVSSGGYIVLVEATGAGQTVNVMRRKIAVVR
jgi:hypothetical protein